VRLVGVLEIDMDCFCPLQSIFPTIFCSVTVHLKRLFVARYEPFDMVFQYHFITFSLYVLDGVSICEVTVDGPIMYATTDSYPSELRQTQSHSRAHTPPARRAKKG
jgi:hypothetical protein